MGVLAGGPSPAFLPQATLWRWRPLSDFEPPTTLCLRLPPSPRRPAPRTLTSGVIGPITHFSFSPNPPLFSMSSPNPVCCTGLALAYSLLSANRFGPHPPGADFGIKIAVCTQRQSALAFQIFNKGTPTLTVASPDCGEERARRSFQIGIAGVVDWRRSRYPSTVLSFPSQTLGTVLSSPKTLLLILLEKNCPSKPCPCGENHLIPFSRTLRKGMESRHVESA